MKRALAVGALALGTACTSTPEEAELRIKVVNGATREPLVGALVSVEMGGIYVKNPDTSRGAPSYKYGGVTSSAGTLFLHIPTDDVGVHTFFDGYYYGSREVTLDQDLGITVNMETFQNNETAPSIQNAKLEPATVAPGGQFVLSADVTRGDADDPLSDEVIVVFAETHFSRALDPPSAGVQGKGFPDGTWKTTLTAPEQPGTYDYDLAATSEHCVNSDLVRLTLEVQ